MKNPVVVARHVLDASTRPLSLSRVPPNFLVGEGAVDFAETHGVDILPGDFLIADGARARWQTWIRDLQQVEAEQDRISMVQQSTVSHSAPASPVATSRTTQSQTYQSNHKGHVHEQPTNGHTFTPTTQTPRYLRELNAYFEDDGSTTDDHLAIIAATRKRQKTSAADGQEEPRLSDLLPTHTTEKVYL